MPRFREATMHYRPDGSIDIEYYLAAGRLQRSHALHSLFRDPEPRTERRSR